MAIYAGAPNYFYMYYCLYQFFYLDVSWSHIICCNVRGDSYILKLVNRNCK